MAEDVEETQGRLADQIHDQVGEASCLLDSHDLDSADVEVLRRAAHHTDGALSAIKTAIHSLSKSHQ